MSKITYPEHLPGESLDALLIHSILRTHHYISPFIDRSLRELRLSGIQFNVLLLLQSDPDGLALSEIGRHLVVTKANVTGLIDRLESKGLVARTTTEDRRVILAKLTEQGLRLVNEVLPRHKQLLAEVGECLEEDEKRQMVTLLSKLRQGMRERGLHHHHHGHRPECHGTHVSEPAQEE